MATRRLEAVGPASPEVAWGRYLQIAAWPTWSPQIARVTASAERLGVGVIGRVHLPGGLGLPFTITAVNAQARSWSWVVRLGLVRLTLHHEVRSHARGSATSLTMEGPDLLLLAYTPLAWVALHKLVARP
jgi:hypothetical protein